MIRCHLSIVMGRHKMKIADVSRQAGLNRSTVTSLYREDATRVDIETIDKLCRLFNCQVADLFEFIEHTEDQRNSHSKSR
jgi:putative transcriptional regulator